MDNLRQQKPFSIYSNTEWLYITLGTRLDKNV